MRRKKRYLPNFILAIISLILFLLLIFLTSPTDHISLGPINLALPTLIFIPLLSFAYFLPTYLLKNKVHGVLACIFVISFLTLRAHGLTHPFFILILVALILTLELLFTKRKA